MINIRPTVYEVSGIRSIARLNSALRIELTWERGKDTGLYKNDLPTDWQEMWAIRDDLGQVFGPARGRSFKKVKGTWDWEPFPSNRTVSFLKRFRFPTYAIAYAFLVEAAKNPASGLTIAEEEIKIR